MRSGEGRRRVVIEKISPQVDNGRFPIKRVSGELVTVEADVFADGHDSIACALLFRNEKETNWTELPMDLIGNDRWRASFSVPETGWYYYTVEGWIDHFRTWRQSLTKRIDAGQDIRVELLIGAALADAAAKRASGSDSARLREWAANIRKEEPSGSLLALNEEFSALAMQNADRSLATRYEREFAVWVDRERARFGAWYELFPRSCSTTTGLHGTLADCTEWLPDIARMGFDIVYLPPVHPIGRTYRKGKNNAVEAKPDDTGSPWAIGSTEGGHKSIHPDLGTIEDFNRLVDGAKENNLEIALDLAFQCTPDHPYVKEHPEWFRHRPDGTIQYAENPPKKYQDIYPIDFETEDWKSLWQELKSVVIFWIERGVRIFRVDNPHTKSFAFWEWLIAEVRGQYADVLFLSEAFTRPKVMYRLAKLGFTQSYTYFAWRNTKDELTQYFKELTQTEVREFFRPNLWPNTPDILTEYLQFGGRPAFMIRLVLAATLGASYGIYGPAYELCENIPRSPGSEEYLNSEKYEVKHRDMHASWSLRDFITRVNRIRKENSALHRDWSLHFHHTDNPMLICYSKTAEDFSSVIVVVVNLDFHHVQSGWVELDLPALGVNETQPFQAHDLLGDGRHLWQGSRNYVELDPQSLPAHIMTIRRKLRTERDFDYFL